MNKMPALVHYMCMLYLYRREGFILKNERVRGYGNVKKSVTFRDNLVVFGLCFVCAAVIGITLYASNVKKNSEAEIRLSRAEYNENEDYSEISIETEGNEEPSSDIESANIDEYETTATEDEPGDDETTVLTEVKPLSFSAPLKGSLMKEQSSSELMYSKTLEDWRLHNGIDIGAKIGSTVCAVADGVVTEAKKDVLYGYTIVIDHGNDTKSIYCNLTGTAMVQNGKTIEKGEPIGMVGDSAICETVEEAHLHFEMTIGGAYVNPLEYFSL